LAPPPLEAEHMDDEGVFPDSPTVDCLRLSTAMRQRFPRTFWPYIKDSMWGAIADMYVQRGGHLPPNAELHVLASLGPIRAISPLREMGLLC
jgi:hypothetical protein